MSQNLPLTSSAFAKWYVRLPNVMCLCPLSCALGQTRTNKSHTVLFLFLQTSTKTDLAGSITTSSKSSCWDERRETYSKCCHLLRVILSATAVFVPFCRWSLYLRNTCRAKTRVATIIFSFALSSFCNIYCPHQSPAILGLYSLSPASPPASS